jgi:hypothetical protein
LAISALFSDKAFDHSKLPSSRVSKVLASSSNFYKELATSSVSFRILSKFSAERFSLSSASFKASFSAFKA